MHWDYAQYQAAPEWMLDLIMPMISIEEKVADLKAKNEANKRQGI